MNSVLVVHLWVGILVAACAALLVWWRPGRRIALYALTLQILLGIWLIVSGLRAPSGHYTLAVLGWAGLMGANAMGRRSGSRNAVLALSVLSALCVLTAYYLGQNAVKHGG